MNKLVALLLACGVARVAGHVPGDDEAGECAPQLPEYNQPLAVASVGIMLAVSLLGSVAPIVMFRVSKGRFVGVLVKVGSFGGAGVILATALVHCLLPANEALTNPCIPAAWHSYEAWAFTLCTATIVFFQILDYFLAVLVERFKARHAQHDPEAQQAQQAHSHHHCDGHSHDHSHDHSHSHDRNHETQPSCGDAPCVKHDNCHDLECGGRALLISAPVKAAAAAGPAGAAAPCGGHSSLGQHPPSSHPPHAAAQSKQHNCHHIECCSRVLLAEGQLDLGKVINLGLAELAVAFHSIIIGVTLGITPAGQFKTLLTALCFHQFLEGFALGSAVVDAGFGAAKAYGLALFYSLSTPLGIAIGIAVRQSFNSNATATLVLEGVLDSVCAGVLLCVVLSGPMNATRSYRGWLQGQGAGVHLVCFAALVGGAAAMALIGKWA